VATLIEPRVETAVRCADTSPKTTIDSPSELQRQLCESLTADTCIPGPGIRMQATPELQGELLCAACRESQCKKSGK
jgi:hypothetical protein